MKEKVLKQGFAKRISKIFTMFLVLAMLVNTINVPMLVHAYELTINNITWGTGDNDKVLSWDPVEGAISYDIMMPNGGGGNTIYTSYDCSNLISQTGTYTPTVSAYDENRVLIAETQGPEKYFEIPQISNPSNIKIENGIVTWDAVPNAGSYNAAIYKYDSEGNAYYSGYHTYINSNTNRILLSSIAAWLVEGETYAVGIQAYSTYNSGYGNSEETRYTFVFQGYPVIDVSNINITWGTGENDKVLYWDPVEGAVKYTVIMGSSGANCYTTSLDCKWMIKGEGTYTPTIEAYDEYGEKIVETKGPEKYFTVSKLATPGNVKIGNNMVTWDAVADASEYRVSLYEYDEETDRGYYVNHFYASKKTNMSLSLYALEDGKIYYAMVEAIDSENYEFAESEPGTSEHFVYEITHAVNTAVVGSGGTVSASATVKHHGDYVVTLKPKKGYVIYYLTVNGVDVTAEIVSNKYTIRDITSDQTVEAGFSTCRHDWVAGEVTKESTCKEAGEQTYTCSVCEETKTESLPKLSIHTWNAGEVYVEPTCGANGLFRYTCEVCGLTKDEILAKTNTHTYGKYVVTTEATCGNNGIKARTCTVCGHVEEALIPATGNHNYSSVTHKCTVCGGDDPSYVAAIKTQPVSVTVTEGATAKFSVTAIGDNLTYKWEKSTNGGSTWAAMAGTTNTRSISSVTMAMNGWKFRVTVTDSKGNSVTSKAVTLTVKASVAITKDLTDVTVTAGEKATFTVTATGEELTYKWQKSTDGTTWATMSGTTNSRSISSVTANMDGWKFRVKVTDKNGKTVTSKAATLTVKPAGPVITTDLTDVSVTVGEKATFTVTATGEELTYKWQKSTDNGTSWAAMSGTTNSRSISSVTANMDGWKFRVKVTDKNGKTVISKAVTLTVKAAGPVITKNLEDASVAVGEKAIFTVTATGEGLTYAWEKSTNGGTTWAAMAGTTNSRSVTATASMNGWKFRVKITDKNGKTVTSAVATMTVGGPVITTQLKNVTVTAGAKATFKVVATGEGLTYKWEKSTNGGKTWVAMSGTTNTRSISSVAASYNGWQFRVIITDKNGKSVTSNAATLTVK